MTPTEEQNSAESQSREISRDIGTDYFIRIPASSPEEGIRFRDLYDAFKLHRILIAVFSAVGLAAGIAVVILSEPVYRVETLLMPVEDETEQSLGGLAGQLGGLAMMAGIDIAGQSNIWVPISMLESRAFAEQFIDDRNLMPELFRDDWDTENNAWDASVADDPPSMWDAYELFSEEILSVDWNNTTQLVVIAVQWRDPQVAVEWTMDIVRRINQMYRQQVIEEANKSIGYLNDELAKTNAVEVRQSIYRLMESQIEKIMMANVREEFAFRVIDPAVAPDADEYVWPNIPLLLGVGPLFGFVLGFSFALIRYIWSREEL